MDDAVKLDGSAGEGGGQVLRTSLALSLITKRPLVIEHIRARRKRPGLLRQHLTCVRAAARVGSALVEGDELGASQLRFVPQAIQHGTYEFKIGTAGSTSLVLQTVLLPLAVTPGRSRIAIEGGTHNPMAPSFEVLQRAYLPLLRQMGAKVELDLIRHGFAPAGGGRIEVHVEGSTLAPLELERRGELIDGRVEVLVSNLDEQIGRRELRAALSRLGWRHGEVRSVDSRGPGNAVGVALQFERLTEYFVAYGKRGVPGKHIAQRLADEVLDFLRRGVPVGEHLADQLMLPGALAGISYRTGPLSSHAVTNLEVIRAFECATISTQVDPADETVSVSVSPCDRD